MSLMFAADAIGTEKSSSPVTVVLSAERPTSEPTGLQLISISRDRHVTIRSASGHLLIARLHGFFYLDNGRRGGSHVGLELRSIAPTPQRVTLRAYPSYLDSALAKRP
jgi:hypothetical protein